jgi:hypothetical protein
MLLRYDNVPDKGVSYLTILEGDMKNLGFVFVTSFLLISSVTVSADIPKLINYQGMLTDNSSNPLTGTYDINFKVYNAPSGGDKRWEETQTDVAVTNGLFNVILGNATLGGIDLDFSEEYWLEVTVEGEQMGERLRFTSVGYAYRALVADSAAVAGSGTGGGGGWVDDGTVVRLQDSTDKVGIGTANPMSNLHLKGEYGAYMRFDSSRDTSWVIGSSSSNRYLKIDMSHEYGGYLAAYISPDGDTRLVPVKGNVGIGTDDPGVKLHIEGGGDVKVNTPNTGYLIMGPSTGAHIAIDNNEIMAKASGDSVGDLYIQWSDEARTLIRGNVGIPTISPSYKLHVTEEGAGSAVYGEHESSGNYGILGRSNSGVYGSSSSDMGVYGVCGSGLGVWGISSSGTGVYYSNGLAGTGSKSCVVKTSQGPTLLYCQESPENWFEDFGEGQLSAGRCHVELDPLFLETVTINEPNPMKVFIQLNDDCNGTYVQRGRAGFDVIELQRGQSNARFTYRVVAKRSGFEGKRLDVCEAAKKDPYLYPEIKEKMEMK